MFSLMKKSAGTLLGLLVAGSAMAQTAPTTVGDLVTGISFASAATAVLGVAAAVIAFKVIKQGASIVVQWISKAH